MHATRKVITEWMILVVFLGRCTAETECETLKAICVVGGGELKGTIHLQEKAKDGVGCNSTTDAAELTVDMDIQGFDLTDSLGAHNFRVKAFAGVPPACADMGPDYGKGLSGADLGTYREGEGGLVRLTKSRVVNGPSLMGPLSIIGHSIAILKGTEFTYKGLEPEIQGCCIVGVANVLPQIQGPRPGPPPFQASSSFRPRPSSSNGASSINTQAKSRPSSSGQPNPYPNSAPRTSFFDLEGKTSRTNSILPSGFKPPSGPSFEDIRGLENGESPLGRSGFGNSIGPSKGSTLGLGFALGNDIRNSFKLTADEIDFPRDSEDENYARSKLGTTKGQGQNENGGSNAAKSERIVSTVETLGNLNDKYISDFSTAFPPSADPLDSTVRPN